MSFPDDETRDPLDNQQPEEFEAGTPDDSMGLDEDFAEQSRFDAEMPDLDDMPEISDDGFGDVSGATADGVDETVEFAAPAETESGIAFQAMGMDEESAVVAGVDESEESLDFAAPAESESGIAFQATGIEEEGEGGEGDDFLAGIAEDMGDFGAAKVDVETSKEEDINVDEEEEKQPAGKRVQKVLAAVAGTDPYTVLMGIALLALMCGVLFFYLELSAYDFDIMAEKAKQLVGAVNLGWLL